MRGRWLKADPHLHALQVLWHARDRAQSKDHSLHSPHQLLPVELAGDLQGTRLLTTVSAICDLLSGCLCTSSMLGGDMSIFILQIQHVSLTPRSLFKDAPPSFTRTGKSKTCTVSDH